MASCIHCGAEMPAPTPFCAACGQPGPRVERPKPVGPALHPLLQQPFRDTLPPAPGPLGKNVALDRRAGTPRDAATPMPPPAPFARAVPPPPLAGEGAVAGPMRAPVAAPPLHASPAARGRSAAAPAQVPAPIAAPRPSPAPAGVPHQPPVPAAVTEAVAPSPVSAAVAPAPAPREAEVAPLWRRACAWTADLAALAVVAGLFLWGATRMVPHGAASQQGGLDWLAETLLAYRRLWLPGALLAAVLSVLYLSLFTALGGQTPGKRLLGLVVIDRTGRCPSPLRSVARAALAIVSGMLGLGGFYLALFDRRRQTLHDKLAGTFVVLGP